MKKEIKPVDTAKLRRRLKKIAGQVQAIDRMVEEEKPCEDILTQINAAKSALHSCGRLVLQKYLQECLQDGAKKGEAETIFVQFAEAVDRFSSIK